MCCPHAYRVAEYLGNCKFQQLHGSDTSVSNVIVNANISSNREPMLSTAFAAVQDILDESTAVCPEGHPDQ